MAKCAQWSCFVLARGDGSGIDIWEESTPRYLFATIGFAE